MVKLAIELIPEMPVSEVIDTICAAEDLGYDTVTLCDEAFMPDVYACLGVAAHLTRRVRLGPITNGYTRNPMVTAVAVATLNDLSNGRAFVTLVPGGRNIIGAMGIERETPLTVVRETVEVMRRLWTGEGVKWQGRRFRLNSPPITLGRQDIPIWIAPRGPKMLELSGECADAILFIARADVGAALEIAARGMAKSGRQPRRIYADRVAYTPDVLQKAGTIFIYALMDAPPRMLHNLGLADQLVQELRDAFASGGLAAAAKLVTPEMIKAYLIAGGRDECRQTLREVVTQFQLDEFMLTLSSSGLQQNIQRMRDIKEFLSA